MRGGIVGTGTGTIATSGGGDVLGEVKCGSVGRDLKIKIEKEKERRKTKKMMWFDWHVCESDKVCPLLFTLLFSSVPIF